MVPICGKFWYLRTSGLTEVLRELTDQFTNYEIVIRDG